MQSGMVRRRGDSAALGLPTRKRRKRGPSGVVPPPRKRRKRKPSGVVPRPQSTVDKLRKRIRDGAAARRATIWKAAHPLHRYLLTRVDTTLRVLAGDGETDAGLPLLGTKPHWARALMRRGKDCENKPVSKPYPYGEELTWVGLVASSMRVTLDDEVKVARMEGVDPPTTSSPYPEKNSLVGFLLLGPPTRRSRRSRWCDPCSDYEPWAVHCAIELVQRIPGMDCPLGLPARLTLQPHPEALALKIWNKLTRTSEFRWCDRRKLQ